MRFRSLALLTFLALGAPALPARAEEKAAAPTLIVRLNSIDGLIADARYLAEAAGKGNEAKQFEGMLKPFIGEKGLEGFDTTKPIALYGRLNAKIEQSDLVLMLPVADEAAVLALLKRYEVKFEKEKDDIYKVELPKAPFPGYFRFANGYVNITIRNPKMLAKEHLLTPAAVLPPGRMGALEVAVDLEQVPESIKEVIVGVSSLRLAEAKGEKKDSQSEAAYKFLCAGADEIASQIKAIINEGKDLNLKLDIDRKNGEMVALLRFTAKPGSPLTASIAEVGQEKSIVANLGGADSAMSGRLYATLPRGLRKSYDAFVDDTIKQTLANVPDNAPRELLEQFFKASRPTLKAAELDAGFDLRGPASNGRYNLVTAIAIKEGADIEKAVRTVHAAIPPDARAAITLDAEKVGSVNIHRFDIPAEKIEPEFKRVFGDGPAYLAIRKDAVLLAVGDKALDNLKDVLAREPKTGKLMHLDLSVARLVPLDRKETAVAVAKKVFGKDTNDDRVRVSLEGGKTLELRLSAKAKMLEFGILVDEAKKKGER